MKKKRTSIEEEVDREIIAKGKNVIHDFDESQALHSPAKKRENRLISIRLPMAMIDQLREAAIKRGDIGYQQMIKIFIADGLLRSQFESEIPTEILEKVDKEAGRVGVPRTSLLKLWIAERVDRMAG